MDIYDFEPASIYLLPVEITKYIFGFMPNYMRAICMFVCTHWYKIANMDMEIYFKFEITEKLFALGNYNLLQWCILNGFYVNTRTINYYLRRGTPSIVRQILSNPKQLERKILATQLGQMRPNTVRVALSCGYSAEQIYTHALENGNLPVIQMLFRTGKYYNRRICTQALMYGTPEILSWALRRGYPANIIVTTAYLQFKNDPEFPRIMHKPCQQLIRSAITTSAGYLRRDPVTDNR